MSVAIEILPSSNAVSARASETIAALIEESESPVLGLATGSTPVDTYGQLVERHRSGLSFANVTTFNLDEYVGLSNDHPQSYHAFMGDNLFDHVDLDPGRTHIPAGDAVDPDVECHQYEQAIATAGGVDLWLLGIGSNGHIAFNEPGCDADSRTRVVELASETITANSRYFDRSEDVPRQAITAGIATILSAERILLLACGASKAEPVCEALAGPISSDCPASFLQEHPDCTFLLDSEAASLLTP
jgi:glucosamine-6-phosphate deaminase